MVNEREPFLILGESVVTMGERGVIEGEGGVAVLNGKIAGVGTSGELWTRFGAVRIERASGALVPGLVNGHVHLELGYQRGRHERPGHFTEWVTGLMANYPAAERVEEVVSGAVREGMRECLRNGVTCVGDISRHCEVTRRILKEGPLRVVSFGELMGVGKLRGRMEMFWEAAADRTNASEFVTVGVSPHAPYTVEGPVLKEVVGRAASAGMPMAMHLGELADEKEFLATLGGKLGEWDVMKRMDVLDEKIARCAEGPLAWAEEWGLMEASKKVAVVLAHVNYCDEAGLGILARSKASVAYCPRTWAYFGHDAQPPYRHRYREMMAAGVNVCLGTDSMASNPDLDLRREGAFLMERGEIEAMEALEMMTIRGARALGLEKERGSLEEGKAADVVAVEGDVVRGAVRGVFVGGKRVDLQE